jgi:hypothetical protein
MIQALPRYKTTVLTTATQPNIPEDGILPSQSPENLTSNKDIAFIFQLITTR